MTNANRQSIFHQTESTANKSLLFSHEMTKLDAEIVGVIVDTDRLKVIFQLTRVSLIFVVDDKSFNMSAGTKEGRGVHSSSSLLWRDQGFCEWVVSHRIQGREGSVQVGYFLASRVDSPSQIHRNDSHGTSIRSSISSLLR